MSWAQPLPILEGDGIPWTFDTQARVTAIGDLHGDLAALKSILLKNNFIDSRGTWIAGYDHLVLNGDLVNLGPDSFGMINFVMKLETEAFASGGKVHVIIGNHEVMLATGKFNRLSQSDKQKFADTQAPGENYSSENLYKAFTGDSQYAKWLRSLNSIIRINNLVFVHAGLDAWALDYSPEEINSTIRAWLKYYQMKLSPDPTGVIQSPPKHSEFFILPGQGPMGTGSMNDEKNEKGSIKSSLSVDIVDRILAQLNASSIVVGHMKTYNNQISQNHSQYGSRLIQLDTGISEVEGGSLSALNIKNNILSSWHLERSRSSLSCLKSVQGNL